MTIQQLPPSSDELLAMIANRLNHFEKSIDKRVSRLERRVDLKPRDPLSVIPIQLICSYLSLSNIAICARISIQWRQSVDSSINFRALTKQRYPAIFTAILLRDLNRQNLTQWKLELRLATTHARIQKLEAKSAQIQADQNAIGRTLDRVSDYSIPVILLASVAALGANSSGVQPDSSLEYLDIGLRRW